MRERISLSIHSPHASLVGSAAMLQPSPDMRTFRIVMRPMNNAALCTPFILPVERYGIALPQGIDLWSQINIMCHQHRRP